MKFNIQILNIELVTPPSLNPLPLFGKSWCAEWNWSIGCWVMFFGIWWVLLWRLKICYFKAVCGVWSLERWDINSQICELLELQKTGKRKMGSLRKLWEKCIKKDLERYGLRKERMRTIGKMTMKMPVKTKIANPGQPG